MFESLYEKVADEAAGLASPRPDDFPIFDVRMVTVNREGGVATLSVNCRECERPIGARRTYCSQRCKERFAWRKRKAKLQSDSDYHRQQLEADTMRRRAAGVRPLRRSVCSTEGCDRSVKGRGLCRKHYERARRWLGEIDRHGCKRDAAGDAWRVEEVVLSAVCSKPGLPTKIKSVVALVTVGIMPRCPVCEQFMAPDSGHVFTCVCGVHAIFNMDEVSWLSASAHAGRRERAAS